MSDSSHLVKKLWSYCNILKDDGLSYGDYLEQLTYLLFLKMADEQSRPSPGASVPRPSPVPQGYDWPSLLSKSGPELERQYRDVLAHLGKQHGLMGLVFRKAQNKIQDPAKLRRLVADLIDRESWMTLGADVKGDAYEGLLERNAQDTKSGAGQYFTPRPLIDAMVACVRPAPGERIIDPACGTGGFLLAAHSWLSHHYTLDREQREFLRRDALRGVEIVQDVTRLCAMNLLLHSVGPTAIEVDALKRTLMAAGKGEADADAEIDRSLPVRSDDALRELGTTRYQVVLTNPPFGKKSSIMVVTEGGDTERETISYERDEFWASTTNKQLNFVKAAMQDKKMEHVILKTVAGFMNLEGGTLLIGVNDDGSIYGLEADYATLTSKGNRDGYELFLTQLLETNMSGAAASLVRISFDARHNNSTRQLVGTDMIEYQADRWA